ncbi:MAG: hypothetical protein D3922_14150, partial [Candidatus Electrothrix sp. AR1]|nr:hypothetical protein [Candidatus Electrothrix sp. AR1]
MSRVVLDYCIFNRTLWKGPAAVGFAFAGRRKENAGAIMMIAPAMKGREIKRGMGVVFFLLFLYFPKLNRRMHINSSRPFPEGAIKNAVI